MKLRYLVGFICLLLFIAAADTIPDPPAINPPSSHSLRVSTLHVHNPSTTLEKKWVVASDTSPSLRVDWFGVRLQIETKPVVSTTVALVHYAADPSPPSLA